jgi:hypothetical protein
MFKLLSIHVRRYDFGSFQKTFKFRFGYDLDHQVVGYEIVHKLLEAMPKFVWIHKICEGQVVKQCFRHLEKLNMIQLSKNHNNN